MNELDRLKKQYPQILEMTRAAPPKPPKTHGVSQVRVQKIRLPDGTEIDIYEETTLWEES